MKYQSPYSGLNSKDAVCLATNENPYPLPEILVDKIIKQVYKANRYPKLKNEKLVSLIADHVGTISDNILVAAGSDELLVLLALSYIQEGKNSIMFNPSFFRYKQVTELAKGACKLVDCENFKCNLNTLIRYIDENTRVVFICNPNNPTGTFIDRKDIYSFLQNIPKDIIVVVDEAYYEFVNEKEGNQSSIGLVDEFSNLVVLRTYSKLFGMAGLRIGYSIANPIITNELEKVRSPYSVNAIAQEAAIAILENEMSFYKDYPNEVKYEREVFYNYFKELSLEYVPSEANFIFVKLGKNCNDIINKLREENIIIRPCDMFGFPQYARITIGKNSENRRLLDALKRLI